MLEKRVDITYSTIRIRGTNNQSTASIGDKLRKNTYRSVAHILADVWDVITIELQRVRAALDDVPTSEFAFQPRFGRACITIECSDFQRLGFAL